MLSPFSCDFRITCPRGERTLFGKNEFHGGIDMVSCGDKTVYAIADGEALSLYEKNGFGRYIRQTLDDGRRIYYAHLESTPIGSRTRIKKGDPIGIMGATGRVTGPHLHIELRPAGTSKESLDIAAFSGIENKTGYYSFPADNTAKALFDCGIITDENVSNWEFMLSGKAELKREYVKTIFDRCCNKIKSLQNELSKG
jgi:murein DD-endopeptidase MepM/ murein hydrolase activator NlpD